MMQTESEMEHDPGEAVGPSESPHVEEYEHFVQTASKRSIADEVLLKLLDGIHSSTNEFNVQDRVFSASMLLHGSHLRRLLCCDVTLNPRRTTVLVAVREVFDSGTQLLQAGQQHSEQVRNRVSSYTSSWVSSKLVGGESPFKVLHTEWMTTLTRTDPSSSAVLLMKIADQADETKEHEVELVFPFLFQTYHPIAFEDGIVLNLLTKDLELHHYYGAHLAVAFEAHRMDSDTSDGTEVEVDDFHSRTNVSHDSSMEVVGSHQKCIDELVKRIKNNCFTFTNEQLQPALPSEVVKLLPLYKLHRLAFNYRFLFSLRMKQGMLDIAFQSTMQLRNVKNRESNDYVDPKPMVAEFWQNHPTQIANYDHAKFLSFIKDTFTFKRLTLQDSLLRNQHRQAGLEVKTTTPLLRKVAQVLPEMAEISFHSLTEIRHAFVLQLCEAEEANEEAARPFQHYVRYSDYSDDPEVNVKYSLTELEYWLRDKEKLVVAFSSFTANRGNPLRNRRMKLYKSKLMNADFATEAKKDTAVLLFNHIERNGVRVLKLLKQMVRKQYPLTGKQMKLKSFQMLLHVLFKLVASTATIENKEDVKHLLLQQLYLSTLRSKRTNDDDTLNDADESTSETVEETVSDDEEIGNTQTAKSAASTFATKSMGNAALSAVFECFWNELKALKALFRPWLRYVETRLKIDSLSLSFCELEEDKQDKFVCKAKFTKIMKETDINDTSVCHVSLIGLCLLLNVADASFFGERVNTSFDKKCKCEYVNQARTAKHLTVEQRIMAKLESYEFKPPSQLFPAIPTRKLAPISQIVIPNVFRQPKMARLGLTSSKFLDEMASLTSQHFSRNNDNQAVPIVGKSMRYDGTTTFINAFKVLGIRSTAEKKDKAVSGDDQEADDDDESGSDSDEKEKAVANWANGLFEDEDSDDDSSSNPASDGEESLDSDYDVEVSENEDEDNASSSSEASDVEGSDNAGESDKNEISGKKRKKSSKKRSKSSKKKRKSTAVPRVYDEQTLIDKVCEYLKELDGKNTKEAKLLKSKIIKVVLDLSKKVEVLNVFTDDMSSFGRATKKNQEKFDKSNHTHAIRYVPGTMELSRKEYQTKQGALKLGQRRQALMRSIKLKHPKGVKEQDRYNTLLKLQQSLASKSTLKFHFLHYKYLLTNGDMIYQKLYSDKLHSIPKRSRNRIDHVSSLSEVKAKALSANKFALSKQFLDKLIKMPIVKQVMEEQQVSDPLIWLRNNVVFLLDSTVSFSGCMKQAWIKAMRLINVPVVKVSEHRSTVGHLLDTSTDGKQRREWKEQKQTCKHKKKFRNYKVLVDSCDKTNVIGRDHKSVKLLEGLVRCTMQKQCKPLGVLSSNTLKVRHAALKVLNTPQHQDQVMQSTQRTERELQQIANDTATPAIGQEEQDYNKLPRDVIKAAVEEAWKIRKPSNSDKQQQRLCYWVACTIHNLQNGTFQPPTYGW